MPRTDYAERKAARIERLRNGAATAAHESHAAEQQARRMADVIPMGQPILVGHYSEGRDRRYRARIHDTFKRAADAGDRAEGLARRAEVAESNRAISSDDPEAVARLRAKLAKVEAFRATAVKVNAAIRTARRKADKSGEPFEVLARAELAPFGWKDETIANLVKPDFAGRIGIPDYELTNHSAEARRIKARIAELERAAARETPADETVGSVTIDQHENRTRLHFPDKPSAELRSELKGYGFRWCPTDGVWQRMASPQAWHLARLVAAQYPTD